MELGVGDVESLISVGIFTDNNYGPFLSVSFPSSRLVSVVVFCFVLVRPVHFLLPRLRFVFFSVRGCVVFLCVIVGDAFPGGVTRLFIPGFIPFSLYVHFVLFVLILILAQL